MDRKANRLNSVDDRDRFMRIASARLRSTLRFMPQRIAVAARMYRDHLERQRHGLD
jgi:hypothetical protein